MCNYEQYFNVQLSHYKEINKSKKIKYQISFLSSIIGQGNFDSNTLGLRPTQKGWYK